MNHDQFRRCIGQKLRLEPRAIGPDDRPVDDDWTVVDVDAEHKTATLENLTRGGRLIVGFDHVRGYDTDPARGEGCGFLNMLWQVRIDREGNTSARPIAVRPAVPPAPEFRPLVLHDGEAERHLT